MIKLYIDPGTGSMLFAILIGALGAGMFLFKNLLVKLRFLFTSGSKKQEETSKLPLVIFSDDKRYWKNFEPICRELNEREIDVTYMTASDDDPALNSNFEHLNSMFVGSGNKAFYKLNFLNAHIVLSTTPGLDVFQWKRSKKVDYYVHTLHAPSDVSMYHMFGIDYYDAILLSADYQIEQVRKMEEMRSLPAKELVKVGLPYMDDMLARLKNDKSTNNKDGKTVLLAPSWGKTAIFSRFGDKIIKQLLKTDYNIIIRPHPQSLKSEKEMIDKLMAQYPDSERLSWNFDNDNYEVLKTADIMISDFSGVIFEFSLVYDKPIVYTSPDLDLSPYDAWWLDEEIWTLKALRNLGVELTEENFGQIETIIDDCLSDNSFAEKRKNVRQETWCNIGEGASLTADYLVQKLDELKGKEKIDDNN